MHSLRASILGKRHLALLLIALALLMKAVLPAGYMVSSASKILTITICSDGTGSATKAQIEIPAKGTPEGDHGKLDGHCPYSSLSMAAMGGAPALLLALTFAFTLLLGLPPARHLPFLRATHLRPPLRGPPATA